MEIRNGLIRGVKLILVSLIASAYATGALGQEDESIEEVVVTGSIRGSLSGALEIKRDSEEFVDGLIAEEFAKFPDNNLGEALQRIPGIVVDRNVGGSQTNAIGEGNTVNVRGLGANFTRTEINGVTATNPGQQRGFGFNVLASELFQSAVVQKSLNASDNEGGLAGTVMLNTYRPLSMDERVIVLTPKSTYLDLAGETSPAATLIYADKSDDNRLGVALVVNHTTTAPQENSVNVSNWDFLRDSMRANFGSLPPEQQSQHADTKIPRDPRILVNKRDHRRANVALTLEAQVSDRLSIVFDNLYADLDHNGRQTRNDYPIEGFPATFLPQDLQTNGDQFVSGTFPAASHFMRILDYEYDVQSSLYQGILSATWDATDNLTVAPRLGYSTAEEHFEWNDFDVRSGSTDIFYRFDGQFVTWQPAIGDPADPSLYTRLARVRNRPDTDQDDEFSFDLDFDLALGQGAWTSLEFGLRFSSREKVFRDFDGRAALDGSLTDLSPYIAVNEFKFDGASANVPTRYLTVDFEGIRQAAAPNGFNVATRPLSNYDISEDTSAAYVMANFDLEQVGGNVGVRLVNTDQASVGSQRVGGVIGPAHFESDYSFVLPSMNLKWDVNDDLVGRLAVYRSLTRALLTDIAPGRTLENYDGGNGTAGNPDLDPFTATNVDIGLEWYFAEDAAFTAAYFSKDLNGLIERIVDEVQVVDPGSGQTITINLSHPVNGDSAAVRGFEVGVQGPFSAASGPLSNAGYVLNATFTDSEAEFTNTADLRSSRLPGLSEESFNAIVYYDAERFSARLAYNWRSDFLQRVSGSGGNPISRSDYGQLDFSSTWSVNDLLAVNFDILNVTNEQLEVFTFLDERFTAGISDTGRRFLLSATFRL